ncbi:MAG: DUF4129 domain-containing protein [Chloroflexota bacterium]
MMKRQKKTALALLAFTAIAVFVLAAVLGQVSLSEGTPVNLGHQREMERAYELDPFLGDRLVEAIRIFMLLIAVCGPVALIYMLFTRRGRRDLLVAVFNAALIFFLLMGLRSAMPEELARPTPTPVEQEILATAAAIPQVEGETFAAEPPEWTIWAVSVVLALLLVLIVVAVLMRFFRRQPDGTLQEIAEEARQAIDDIQAGGDLRQIIIKCYFDMMGAVKKTRGIVRDQAMTPDEFEALLEKKGFPAGPLQRLTRLFEDVRYGTRTPAAHEEQLAILCLQEIVAACQKEESVA